MKHIPKTIASWLTPLLALGLLVGCETRPGVTSLLATGVPSVISTSPADGATDVVLNTKIAATFSEAMDSTTINASTFLVMQGTTQVSGTVSYTGTTATFAPTSALSSSTTYTVTLTTDAHSASGESLSTNSVWSFTTGTTVSASAPTVESSDPADAATDVPTNQNIAVTFSTAMDAATISASTFVVTQGTSVISGTVTYSGTTAHFVSTDVFAVNTVYTVKITTGAQNLSGTGLAVDYVWSFTSGTEADIIAPQVSLTDPADGDLDIALNQKIAATFSKGMDASTITAVTFTVTQGSTPVAGSVSFVGTTAVFAPSASLLAGTVYTATVTTGVKDLSGNALEGNYVWSFTTGTTAVAVAPTVTLTSPLDAETGVALNQKIAATFSKTMDATTISATTVLLVHGNVAVSGLVTYSGTTAKFTPSANLLPNTLYTATVTTGAKDLSGTKLLLNYVWSFTTGAATVVVPPTVSLTDPLNLATGVILKQKIGATFSKSMDPLTITTASFSIKQGAANVPGTVKLVGTVATFTPSVSLLPNTTYTATITTAAKDLSGNRIANNYVWTFTTMPAIAEILQSAATYGGFGGSAGLTNQGIFTVINGDIGTTAACTLVTGFHDKGGEVYTETPLNVGNVKGEITCAPPAPGTATKFAAAVLALGDATTAYNHFAGLPGGADPGAGELGGLVLAPGTYTAAGGTFAITGNDLTLDAQNNPNAQWVFQMAATLTVGQPGQPHSIILVNGAQAKNVVWQVGSAATINGAGGGTMVGTIISYAGVTFSTAGNVTLTTLNGRAISLNASVTMVNTVINVQ